MSYDIKQKQKEDESDKESDSAHYHWHSKRTQDCNTASTENEEKRTEKTPLMEKGQSYGSQTEQDPENEIVIY